MRLKDPETGEPYTCSERFVEGLLKRAAQRGGHDLRQYKSSALDPKRAAAATPYAPGPPAPRSAGASCEPRVTCTWRRPAAAARAPTG